jgi:hypothetical protein
VASSRPPSPQATGGAGTNFEYRLAAIAFSALLRGIPIPGLVPPVEAVGLQQRVAGYALDDVVVWGRAASLEQTIEYQVKRTLAPIASDDDFVAVVGQCLSSIERHADDVEARRHRLGIASGGPLNQLADLHELTELARAHSAPSSMSQALASSRSGVRDRHHHLSRAVETALEMKGDKRTRSEDIERWTWRVAAALHVWRVDAEDGGRDVTQATGQLRDVMPQDSRASAEDAFAQLVAVAQAWGPRAARVDGPMLRAELERRGIELSAAPAQRGAFDRLIEAGSRALDRIPTKFGESLTLSRPELVDRIVTALSEQGVAVLRGPAGAGKSALAALAVRQLRGEGAVVAVLSLAGRTGERLADLESGIGADIRMAMRGAPTNVDRLVLIDGAEEALTDQGSLLVGLLQAIPISPEEAPPFRILITARDEAADSVADWVTGVVGYAPAQVSVGDLTDDEIERVLSGFPRLRALARDARSLRLLRRPYLIELLLRATVDAALPGGLLGEEDVVHLVVERLVRRREGALPGRGTAEARYDVFSAMAEAVIANGVPASLRGYEAEARAGLTSDGVLQRLRGGYQFAHDILADYAVVDLLLRPDGDRLIPGAASPRRLLRAVRVWMQSGVAVALKGAGSGDVDEAWRLARSVAAELSGVDGPRWTDVPFEALLSLGRADEVLSALKPTLLADDGSQLKRLLEAAGRFGRAQGPPIGERGNPPLDVSMCAPLIRFLADVASEIAIPVALSATGIVREAALALAGRSAAPRTELPGVERLPDALVAWAVDSTGVIEATLASLALLSSVLTPSAEEFLLDCARARHVSLDVIAEDPVVSHALVRDRPDLMLRLAGLYYIDEELVLEDEPSPSELRPGSAQDRCGLGDNDDPIADFEHGVRSHSITSRGFSSEVVGFAHPSFGPFLGLLESSSKHGLRLVGALVDVATDARVALEESWERSRRTIELRLPGWPEPREYVGTPDVWMWYRRNGTGPYPAMSALLALREWAAGSARSGTPVRDVVEDVLQCGRSLGLVAVAYSILVENIEQLTNELEAFLEHPLIWDLETPRVLQEQIGFAHPLDDAPRLLWLPSQVAASLVLSNDADGRERLKKVGQLLRQRHVGSVERSGGLVDREGTGRNPESDQSARVLLGRRREAELDSGRFRMEKTEKGTEITIDYPEEVVSGLLDEGGRVASLRLEYTALATRALKTRDGEGEDSADPVALWTNLQRLGDLLVAEDALAVDEKTDAEAAAAAAVLAAAASGQPVDQAILVNGARLLVGVARALEPTRERGIRHMAWRLGADRSAASGLPVLLLDSELRRRCGIESEDLKAGTIALAGSPFEEVRSRLASGVNHAWNSSCLDDSLAHDVALAALRELVATSGLGEWEGAERPASRLPEPIERALSTSDLAIIPAGAADALPGLVKASHHRCAHGQAAGALLEAIVRFDQMAWPSSIARHGFHVGAWRIELDALTAELTLEGDPGQLRQYLQAFAEVGEDLRGLLVALAEGATTMERAVSLHGVWPEILGALLPESRNIVQVGGRRPSQRDRNMLDAVLLPIPPAGAEWPVESTRELLRLWLEAFPGAPHVADQLIRFLVRFGWLMSPTGTGLVLDVLGKNARAISRESTLVAPWLGAVLRGTPTVAGDRLTEVHKMLDALAQAGEESAVALQRELEA